MPRKRVGALDSYHDLPLDDPLRRKIQNRNAQRVYRARHSNRALSATSRLFAPSSDHVSTPKEHSPVAAIAVDSSSAMLVKTSSQRASSPQDFLPELGLQTTGDSPCLSLLFDDTMSTMASSHNCDPDSSPQAPIAHNDMFDLLLADNQIATSEHYNDSVHTTWSAASINSEGQEGVSPSLTRNTGTVFHEQRPDNDFLKMTGEQSQSQQRDMRFDTMIPSPISLNHDDGKEGEPRLLTHRSNCESPARICDPARHLIHTAAQNGQVHIVRLLLESDRQINVNLRDFMGRSALHIAAEEGHCGVVKLLICSGGSLDLEDHEGWTPLHLAARSGHAECVTLLLTLGADTWQRAI